MCVCAEQHAHLCKSRLYSLEYLLVNGGRSAHCVCYSLTRRSTPLHRLMCWKVCVLLCACCLLVQGSETEPGTEEPGELDCVSLGGYLALWNRHSSLSRCQNFLRSITLNNEKSQLPGARLRRSFPADELPRITFHSLAWKKKSHVKSVTQKRNTVARSSVNTIYCDGHRLGNENDWGSVKVGSSYGSLQLKM